MKLWIGKLQKGAEAPFIVLGQRLVDVLHEADQQRVELPHPASTTPAESPSLCVHGAPRWLMAPVRDQLLDFSDRLGGVQVLGARLSAVEDRMTPIESEGILQ